jgi:hypothetical protein
MRNSSPEAIEFAAEIMERDCSAFFDKSFTVETPPNIPDDDIDLGSADDTSYV